MSERFKNTLLGISIALLVIACFAWIGVKIDAMRWTSDNIKMEKSVSASHKAYNRKMAKLQYEIAKDGGKSANPALKALSVQNSYENIISHVGTKFFSTLYTYEDAKQYGERKTKLQEYASDDILNDKSIIGDKKSVEMVKATGLSCNFDKAKFWIENVDDHNVTALARVKFTSSYSGGQPGTGIRVYELTYDTAQQKITKLQLVQNSVEK